jgi:DNA helicase-2/ATP-dependent DNA helicase PcrA
LLSRAACVLELIGKHYPVIILDEFQDTDDAQWELVKLLSKHSCLITLADPDQRIFEYDIKVDPKRLDHLRTFLQPTEFDLGNANHRSPDASILGFADAVLRNEPLPKTDDVEVFSYWGNSFQAAVHAHVIWLYTSLLKKPIPSPTVAVLCRTNLLVADVSTWLNNPHSLNGTTYRPVEHHVLLDAELTTAAAEVVASILEWPQRNLGTGVAATLGHISNYYELKNAVRPSKAAQKKAASYRKASTDVLNDHDPRPQAAKRLVQVFTAGITLHGSPVADWLLARRIIADIPELKEVSTDARFVRLFRATDEIGSALGKAWLDSGGYGRAAETVRRTLEARQLISANTEPTGIVLMTMHKAKGKEFDGVVIVEGWYSGKFFDERSEAEPFEATRRLLRVAITRARHKVCIVRRTGVRALTDR